MTESIMQADVHPMQNASDSMQISSAMLLLHDTLRTPMQRLPMGSPGFSTVVLQHQQVTFELHHGMASVELQVPLSGRSAYYLASESKQFTAACVMTLVRNGVIGLDENVVPHLPELKALEREFSLRSLLNHTSGIPDYLPMMFRQLGRHEADYFNNDHILRLIALFDEVEFAPGTRHDYSNSNYILLATLVERLTGMPLARYAQQHLFAPLGITQMTFDADRFSVMPHRVFSYESDPARPMSLKQSLGNANTVGDGGLYASTDELVIWERNWHRQWQDSASLLQDMLQPSSLVDGTGLTYRFGLEIGERNGETYVFHGGGLWGFRTMILRVPARELSIIHLANHEGAEVALDALLDAVFAA